jgi:recombination protein RecA
MTPPKAKVEPRTPRQRPASLDALREKMTQKYGDGRVSRRESIRPYEVIPTGSLSLDLATRVGGWVRGRIHEIIGQEGNGKTTLVINSMAQAQIKYPHLAVGYIDMEQTFDWPWAESNGLDTSNNRFLHAFPDDAEDVSDQIKEMMETGLFSMVVVDSIGGMESKQAFDKEAEEAVMGRNAQIITRMVKRLAMLARREQVAVLLVNQYRANLANPKAGDQSAGPKALKYATTMKVDIRRTGETPLKVKFPDDAEPQVVGIQFKARVSRSKVAAQGKTGTFWIINQPSMQYGDIGIDVAEEALAIGIFTGVIRVEGGGYHSMPWTKDKKDRIRGRDSVLAYLREHRDKALKVRDAAVAMMSAEIKAEVEVAFDPVTGELLDEVTV